MMNGYRSFLLSIVFLSLCSCAIFQSTKEKDHKAICKELNRQIIWNRATSDPVALTQQGAETETLAKNYRDEGCE